MVGKSKVTRKCACEIHHGTSRDQTVTRTYSRDSHDCPKAALDSLVRLGAMSPRAKYAIYALSMDRNV